MPGVLDDLYADAADRELGVSWQGRRPTLSLWAPTAQSVAALVGALAGYAIGRDRS